MANLNFSDFEVAAPPFTVRVSDGTAPLAAGLYINVSALTGDSVLDKSSTAVVEACVKMCQIGNKAQTTANALPGAEQIRSFPAVSYGTPIVAADGSVNSTVTATVIGQAPLDRNNISANV